MKHFLLLVLSITLYTCITHAQTHLRKTHFNIEKTLALQGYDPVAYFTQNKAVKGNKQFSANADGVIYYFSSAANKDLFVKDYSKYEPQYGGWCAYAMGATNTKVEIDPETFKIINGKLYLFYHSWVNNTLNKWNKDETNLKTKADKNWSLLYK
jgi:YHS domain-containing protein